MLGHRAKDVDRQLIGVRHVYRNEIHPGFHQVRDEGHVRLVIASLLMCSSERFRFGPRFKGGTVLPHSV